MFHQAELRRTPHTHTNVTINGHYIDQHTFASSPVNKWRLLMSNVLLLACSSRRHLAHID